jgi:hypothetical protein
MNKTLLLAFLTMALDDPTPCPNPSHAEGLYYVFGEKTPAGKFIPVIESIPSNGSSKYKT